MGKKKIDYEKLWNEYKSYLQEIEGSGNMFQQALAQSYLDLMNKLESEEEAK